MQRPLYYLILPYCPMTREYEDNKNHDGFWESPSGRLLLALLKAVVVAGCFFALLFAIFGRFM